MKAKSFLLGFLLVTSSQAFAVNDPAIVDREITQEIKASQEVLNQLNNEPIISIQKFWFPENRHLGYDYLVKSQNHDLKIKVVYESVDWEGNPPHYFEYVVSAATM